MWALCSNVCNISFFWTRKTCKGESCSWGRVLSVISISTTTSPIGLYKQIDIPHPIFLLCIWIKNIIFL